MGPSARRRSSPAPQNNTHRLPRLCAEGGADADAEFEERLAALKRAKGETPYGEASSSSSKAAVTSGASECFRLCLLTLLDAVHGEASSSSSTAAVTSGASECGLLFTVCDECLPGVAVHRLCGELGPDPTRTHMHTDLV